MAMTKAQLQEAYDYLRDEHDRLCEQIIEIAGEAVWKHDLCEEMEESVRRLGIHVPDTIVTVTKTVVERYRLPGFTAARHGLLDSGMSDIEKAQEVREMVQYGSFSDYLSASQTDANSVTVTVERG